METVIAQTLTPKQRHFCDEYLTDHNATRAALRAGYSSETALSGYLMTLPKIKMYLQQQCDATAEHARITHEMVLRELGKIAFANMADYFTDGKLRPIEELSEDAAAALWQVQADAEGAIKVRMHNKLSALEKIAKHINFYKPEVQKREVVYVYLDKKQLDANDTFEDKPLRKQVDRERLKADRLKDKGLEEEQEGFEEEVKDESRKVKGFEQEDEDMDNGPDGFGQQQEVADDEIKAKQEWQEAYDAEVAEIMKNAPKHRSGIRFVGNAKRIGY